MDPRDLRNALGRFATGVTVITTRTASGKFEGLTANSFSAALARPAARPLEPPAVGAFAAELPRRRAASRSTCSPPTSKLAASSQRRGRQVRGRPFAIGLRGCPLLTGSLAIFECQTENTVEGGDHLIFIGRVVAAAYREGEPLVFSAGDYCVPVRHAPAEPQRLHARPKRCPEIDQMKLGFFTMPIHPVGRKLTRRCRKTARWRSSPTSSASSRAFSASTSPTRRRPSPPR